MRVDYSDLFKTRRGKRGVYYMKMKKSKSVKRTQVFPKQIFLTSDKYSDEKLPSLDGFEFEKDISTYHDGKKIGVYKLVGFKKLIVTKKLV
jgi:hypothetical protein